MYLKDPVNKQPSVTLTLVVISFAIAVIAAGLEISGVTKGTSIVLELFVGNLSVYIGRRLTFSNKTYGPETATNGESK